MAERRKAQSSSSSTARVIVRSRSTADAASVDGGEKSVDSSVAIAATINDDSAAAAKGNEPIFGGTVADLELLLSSKIIPNSMVPMAVANGMLFIGAHVIPSACYFALSEYLIVAGTNILLITVVGVLFRYIINWIVRSRVVTNVDYVILRILEVAGKVVALVELIHLIVGGCLIIPHLFKVQFSDRDADDYCDREMFVFSAALIGICWLIFIFAGLSGIYIFVSAKMKKK